MKKYFNKTAEELKALQQAKVAGIDQITSLRTVTKSISLYFTKLNTDVLDLLSQEDKDVIEEIVKDMTKEIEKCEGTVSKLKAHTRKRIHTKSELEVFRDQLNGALSTLQYLHAALNGLVSHQLNEHNTQTDAFGFGKPESYAWKHCNVSTSFLIGLKIDETLSLRTFLYLFVRTRLTPPGRCQR